MDIKKFEKLRYTNNFYKKIVDQMGVQIIGAEETDKELMYYLSESIHKFGFKTFIGNLDPDIKNTHMESNIIGYSFSQLYKESSLTGIITMNVLTIFILNDKTRCVYDKTEKADEFIVLNSKDYENGFPSSEDIYNILNNEIFSKVNIIIPWSGGWDSTLLYLKVLGTKLFKRISVPFCSSENLQTQKQREARDMISEELKKLIDSLYSEELEKIDDVGDCDICEILDNEININIPDISHMPSMPTRNQLPMILTTIMYSCSCSKNIVLYPIIKQDNWSKDDITCFKEGFINFCSVYSGNNIAAIVDFPLIEYDKVDVIEEIFKFEKDYDISIHDKIYTCECGYNVCVYNPCKSCKVEREALESSKNPDVHKYFLEKYEKEGLMKKEE